MCCHMNADKFRSIGLPFGTSLPNWSIQRYSSQQLLETKSFRETLSFGPGFPDAIAKCPWKIRHKSISLSRPRISLLDVAKVVPVLIVERGVFCSQGLERALLGGNDMQSLGGCEVEMYAARYAQS